MSLALIAGRGRLPALVAEALEVKPLVCAYEGAFPDDLLHDLTFRLETLGSLLIALGEKGVTEVCFAGGLDRPEIDPAMLDAETAPLVPLFQEALEKGDDGALRIVLDLSEKTGFTVRAAHELAPDLLAPGGVYGDVWPDGQMRHDASNAARLLAERGALDQGQACVMAGGKVAGYEESNGTDALIRRHGPYRAEQRAILFKAPKPQQDRRVDLPTIGPDTIDAAGNAGMVGVVIDAGDVLVLDRDRCVALANHHGLVLWARTGE